jgi:uncharacterized protein (TIGR00251 family)
VKVAILTVHVQPRSSRTEIVGWHGDALKVRVKAPPVDGAANDELARFVAQEAGVARSAVRVVSGTTGRRKRISVDGLSTEQLLVSLGISVK